MKVRKDTCATTCDKRKLHTHIQTIILSMINVISHRNGRYKKKKEKVKFHCHLSIHRCSWKKNWKRFGVQHKIKIFHFLLVTTILKFFLYFFWNVWSFVFQFKNNNNNKISERKIIAKDLYHQREREREKKLVH